MVQKVLDNCSDGILDVIYRLRPGETLYIINKRNRKVIQVIRYDDVKHKQVVKVG